MSAQPLNREQWLAYCATLAQSYERAMNNDNAPEFGTDASQPYGAVNAIDLIHRNGATEKDVMQVYDGIFDAIGPYLSQALTSWISDPDVFMVEPYDKLGMLPPLSFNLDIEIPRAKADVYTRRYDFGAILLKGAADGDYTKDHIERVIAGARDLADALQVLVDDPNRQW